MRLDAYLCPWKRPVVLVIAAAAMLCLVRPSVAATLTVCRSGCLYTDFQLALDAAQPGDTILLRAGETFVGNFILPAKPDSGASILIRSDAPDASVPPAGSRLVPNGYDGGNTDRAALAKLTGRGGIWKTTPILQAAPRAHHYRLQFIEFDGFSQLGWETIVEFGNNSSQQNTVDVVPYSIVLDRVFVHGHPTKMQKRCISLNGRDLEVLNSYIVDCASFAVDSQAIAGFNGPGPFRIVNNYLVASTENIMFGGADPRIPNLVPSDIEISRNHISKPLAWRDPILAPPSGAPTASVAAGAGLLSGTLYFTVVAILDSGSDIAQSAQSPQRAVSIGGGPAAVVLNWNAVSNADKYRIYIGDASGAQNRYVETPDSSAQFIYRGGGEVWRTPPSAGTRWNVKNLLELKNAQRVLIDGNIFEHVWPAAQNGYAILLTPRNDDGSAPWSVVRDVTLSNNILRHVAGGISILGEDDINGSERTGRVTIRNNVAYDISAAWGGASHFVVMSNAPFEVTLDHNTVFHEGMVVLVDDGAVPGFRFTNNVMPHNLYGIFGSSAGTGTDAVNAYFPDAIVARNAFGGGPASAYPAGNFFPDLATFMAQFQNPGAADFRLVAGSSFRGAGTDGKDLGVDFAAFAAATGSIYSGGDASGGGGGSGGGSAVATPLPGVIQAEDFDDGTAGTAFSDTTSGNLGGEYRATDVDIEVTSDTGGGYNVGWTRAGEWLRYSVNVGTGGDYHVEFRVASANGGGTFHLEIDGVDRTGPIAVPYTGGWQSWITIPRDIALTAGVQHWRLVFGAAAAGIANINYIRVVAAGGGGGGGGSGSTPFAGTAVRLPATIEAENYDLGGAGVAYSDASSGNTGGEYRAGDVDLAVASDTGDGYTIGWVDAGEWLKYTVDVAAAGTYDIDVRVASWGAGGTFHIEIGGIDKTGPMNVPNTDGWQSWTTIRRTGVTLAAGTQVWRLVMDRVGETGAVGNINWIRVRSTSGSGGGGSTPVSGTPVALPGTLQAEAFDNGGAGVAFHDLTAENEGGVYRSTGVDIADAIDTGGGYTLGWTQSGEWLQYTVDVANAGTYDLEVRVASAGTGGTFHIEVNGVDRTGTFTIPNTGGWQSWVTIRRTGLSLSAGQQVWRVVMDANGSTGSVGNINYFRLVSAGQGSGSARDIILYATDVTGISGNWARLGSGSGAAGMKMQSTEYGWNTNAEPLASPADYFEARFTPEANRAYRVWLRLRSFENASHNDSVWVQFSGAVDAGGAPLWRIGSGAAWPVNLESCSGCGMANWGWTGGAWWIAEPGIVRFPTADVQTIRIQTREDGVDVDQIVLSPVTYFNVAPGGVANDTTIVPKQ